MISLLVYFLLIRTLLAVTNRDQNNGGSSLFYNKRFQTGCWTKNELTKLRARKVFEQLALPALPPEKVDSKYLRNTIKYFRSSLKQVQKLKDQETRESLREALADTFGGNLRSNILPTTRIAFYAGYVHFREVRQLHDFTGEMKNILNTRGLGWQEPGRLPGWSDLSVAKITIGSGKFRNPCTYLNIKRDGNLCITLPSPQLDDPQSPSAIALPFKSVRVFSMTAAASENVLVKYYTTVSRCILHRSPKKCRHSDFVNFNNEMWHWLKTDVASHLLDEKLYSAFGGVLRVAAAARSHRRGMPRRDLIKDEQSNNTRWLPYLVDSHVSIDTDWTPTIYICCTFLASLLIFMLQIFYGKIFSSGKGACECIGCPTHSDRPKDDKEVHYANVDSNFPAILPRYTKTDTFLYEKESSSPTPRRGLETQTVFDLNENRRRLMEVPLPSSERASSVSDKTSSSEGTSKASYDSEKHSGRSSPPKLETPMYQLKINKTPAQSASKRHQQAYSAKTCTEKQLQTASDSSWTASSSSARSRGSMSSKASCRSRSSRDMEWARRVVSRHSLRRSTYRKTASGPDFDVNSYTTPPSGR